MFLLGFFLMKLVETLCKPVASASYILLGWMAYLEVVVVLFFYLRVLYSVASGKY